MEKQITTLEQELDKIAFEINRSQGHLAGMSYEEYLKLLETERAIKKDPAARETNLEEVITDLKRYGEPSSALLIQTFQENTQRDSIKASRAGRQGKVVYLATGKHIHAPNKLELGLLSAHVPGSSGGGGWGMNGDRRLVIASSGYVATPTDPEKWLERTLACAYEESWGEIAYKHFSNPDLHTLLYVMIENTKAKNCKREIKK